MQGALSPQDNAELLAVLGGLARDRPDLDKRAVNKAELAVLRLVFQSRLLIAMGSRKQPLLLPAVLARAQGGTGRVAVVFTDEEAAQGWMDARRPEGPACLGYDELSRFLGDRPPDPKRWHRQLVRARVDLLSVNPAGPLTFTASRLDFDQAISRLAARRATVPQPDLERAWLELSARAAVRVRAHHLLDQLRRDGSAEETEEETDALDHFGSRLFQSQVFLLARQRGLRSSVYASIAAVCAGDPCLAVDGLLEAGAMALSALERPEVDGRQRKLLRKQARWIASMLDKLSELGYRTDDIKRFPRDSKR